MGHKQKFKKPPLTYPQQLHLLKERGMSIEDDNKALALLSHLNYYRLTPYWIPFQKDPEQHIFYDNTSFNQIISLYEFDKKLRLLIFEAIEKIEVSVRAKWAYELAIRHGSHAHMKHQIARDFKRYCQDTDKINKAVEQAKDKEVFIQHYLNNYAETLPPIWVVSEVISFGLLSKLYTNLNDRDAKNAIAHAYGVDSAILESWLHVLTQVRNFSAHHARLWNREFKRTPMLIRSKPSILKNQFVNGSRKLYNVLVIILYLMDKIDVAHPIRDRFKTLLNGHPWYLPQMGFPLDWQEKTLWH
jgi:abortive infection bacteriophage resistance protein